MTTDMLALVAGGLAVGYALVAYAWTWAQQRRALRDTRVANALIRPPRRIFLEQDDALRVATTQRRAQADGIKRKGRSLETNDDRRTKIHLVG